MADQNDDQNWLIKWAREHAPELVDIIENPASDIPDSTVLRLTGLWFWRDDSQNAAFINAQRAKRLADYYSTIVDAETLADMRANFKVDRGRADRFAKHRPIRISEAELQWLRKHAPELLVDDDKNFRIWKPRANPDNSLANDPKAERRHTQKQLRRVLIGKAFHAYMAGAPQEKAQWRKRAKTTAVRQILEGWITQGWAKDKGFERTIWRRLPKKK